MRKIYVLDTNVVLHDPMSIYSFVGNEVVIPFSVIEEVDNSKKKQDIVGQNARRFSRELDSLMQKGDLTKEVYLEEPDVGITIEKNHDSLAKLPSDFQEDKADNRILSVAKEYAERNVGKKEVILVSKDTNLRVKAHLLGINVENYKTDAVEINTLYSGYSQINVDDKKMINDFYDLSGYRYYDMYKDTIKEYLSRDIYPNEYINLVCSDSYSTSSVLFTYSKQNNSFMNIKNNVYPWGIEAKNREQTFAIDALLNDDIELVSLVGKAGTGKTLLALAAGLELVLNKEKYDRVVVLRPVIPMGGHDIGYLPGNKEEKLEPWMSPIKDNLSFLLKDKNDSVTKGYLDKYLDMEALTYIRGRSIPNQFIIVDESQNTTKHELKTILTRVGKNSKVVLTGDPYQIDQPYLDSNTNGLTYVVDRMKHYESTASVTLNKGERSDLAELSAEVL